jgi:diaminohydroxyphosphoribosylaminopyrimidine deaminase/5-amino-6-(5-phosphoribosylamino)uracil reductase
VNIHEKYIKRCIELAKNGLVTARPNPSVGCVIVCDNRVIGEGFTSSYGGNHAEVNAIQAVKEKALLKKATLYVSLEPCNHFGKTPPCSDLLVKYGVKNVVIGCVDPYDKVAGSGIKKLEVNGCNVVVGVLEKECIESNQRFFTFHTKKRPYIILKWAETNDGFLDKKRGVTDAKKPNWITGKSARQLVHQWRAEEDAILIGTTTAINDNPKLNVRDWSGKNPTRIILDRSLRIPKEYHIYNDSARTIILTEQKRASFKNIIFEPVDFSRDLAKQVCAILYAYGIQSLFIEGGKQTLQTFIDANVWDEARIFKGNVSFLEGVLAPKLNGIVTSERTIKEEHLKIIKNRTI